MTWPTCPDCRQPMWTGNVDAPLRVVHGCALCGTRSDQPAKTAVLDLFEEEGP